MTVTTLTNKVTYIGNGSATQFAVPFKVLDVDHLVVKRRLLSSNEIDHTYLGTDYSYSGIGDDSGTLTLDGTALSSLYQLEIERVVPYTQPLDIVNSGGFYPETVEEQLDLTTMQVQQIAAQSDDIAARALMVPVGDTAPDYDTFTASFQGDPGGNAESIGPFTTAHLLTIPVGTNRVATASYYPGVIGGGARYVYDATIVTDTSWSFVDAAGRGFRIDMTQKLFAEQFGVFPGIGYLATNHDLLLEMHDSHHFAPEGAQADIAPELNFGDAIYYFDEGFDLKRIVNWIGTVEGHNNFASGTRFHFPNNIICVTINRPDTAGGTVAAPEDDGYADGSLIHGIHFVTDAGAVAGSYHCIWMRARATIERCCFGTIGEPFGGNAIHIVANSGGAGADRGNANNWRVTDCYTEEVIGHGLYVSGTDANAGRSIGFESRKTGGCGILDIAGLGANTHINPNIAGNDNNARGRCKHGGRNYILITPAAGAGAANEPGTGTGGSLATWEDVGAATTWTSWSNAITWVPGLAVFCWGTSGRSVVVGPYTEGDYVHTPPPAVGIGGQTAYTRQSATLYCPGGAFSAAAFSNSGMGGWASYPVGHPGYTAMGAYFFSAVGTLHPSGIGSGRNILETRRAADGDLSYLWNWNGADQVYYFSGQKAYFTIFGKNTAKTCGRSAAVPYTIEFTDPAFRDPDNAANSRIIGVRDAAPVAGEHARGEIYFNVNPTAGGTVGWVCTTGGTPGTWKTFGAIAA